MNPKTDTRVQAIAFAIAAALLVWLLHVRLLAEPGRSWVGLGVWLAAVLLVAALALFAPRWVARTKRSRAQKTIGGYRLLERIAVGGMGEVWRAEHTALHRAAAVKLIRPQLFAGSTKQESELLAEAFSREAQSTAALTSPHVVQLFDYGITDEGIPYYAMELLGGLSLAQLIDYYGAQPPERVVSILMQVCTCLDEAHRQGIVHRDIKLGNIQLTVRGNEYDFVKVFDFGLADRSGVPRAWPARTMIGTPGYAAPEALSGFCQVDWRADLYSLGCVAYSLLTGTTVFDRDSESETLRAHLNTPPIPPSLRAGVDLPAELDQLVLALLAKDPQERPCTAAEVLRRLQSLQLASSWTQEQAARWWRSRTLALAPAKAERRRNATIPREEPTLRETPCSRVEESGPRASLPFVLCRVRARG